MNHPESAKVTDTNYIDEILDDFIEEILAQYVKQQIRPDKTTAKRALQNLIAQETTKAQQQLLADIKASLPEKKTHQDGIYVEPDRPRMVADSSGPNGGFNDCLNQVTAVLEGYQKQGNDDE
jgi:type IV secretory pathway VirB4 component